MNARTTPSPYKCHRFPSEIISHCVWLYFRFCLSYRHRHGVHGLDLRHQVDDRAIVPGRRVDFWRDVEQLPALP